MYSLGTSEEYLGRALRDLDVPRSDVVIATKVNGRMRKQRMALASRKAIMTEIDDSLRRLGTTTSTSIRSTAGTPNAD